MYRIYIIVVLTALLACGTAMSETVTDSHQEVRNYYSDVKRGWWWYEKLPEKEKQKEEEPVQEEKPVRKLPSLKDYTEEQLWNMHPDDFQALLMEFMKKAVQFPTVENVTEYYTMQDIARRKALAFTNVAAYVVDTNPQLNVGKDYPVAVPGRTMTVKQQFSEIESIIRSSRDDFALIYFYSPTCPYCEVQSGINKYFVEKYGWQIKGIDVTANSTIASRFGVTTTPTMIMIYKKSQDYQPVSMGVISMDELERKVYRGMRLLKGEITPEEYSLYEFQRGSTFDPRSFKLPNSR